MRDRAFDKLSDVGMILAAGEGTRMRPLSLQKPKPLLEVGGRPLLDWALDKLAAAGMRRVVINAHYLADQIAAYAAARQGVVPIDVSFEAAHLETGGGVKKALPAFGEKPFFVLGGDLPFWDGPVPSLTRMARFWDDARMDVLLLIKETAQAPGFAARGDFSSDEAGRLFRQDVAPPRPFVYISAMIVKPELYPKRTETFFSNNLIFDAAEQEGRLFGLVHDGPCFHVSTPADLDKANAWYGAFSAKATA